MAGIGFVLRRLAEKESFANSVRAYFHAVLASAGPWLITVLALTAIFYLTKDSVGQDTVIVFRTVTMYNFCLSTVLTAAISIVAIRFLSDCIYAHQLGAAPGMLLGVLAIMLGVVGTVGVGFYFFLVDVTYVEAIASIVQLLILGSVWIATVFVSALKFYSGITYSTLAGMLCSIVATLLVGESYGPSGMILAFSSGFAVTFAAILALVFAEYPKVCKRPFLVLGHFSRYKDLALSSFLLAVAVWADKWIMWLAPEAEFSVLGLPRYSAYDAAMFFAYLTIFPSMAVFLISQETVFFECYLRFYNAVSGHRPYRVIVKQHEHLMEMLWNIVRSLMVLQLFIGCAVAFVAPKLFSILGISLVGVGIFRFGVLGVAFQILATYIGVFISYFDHRRGLVLVNGFFLITNCCFTVVTLYLGFPTYGYGFFLSCLLTFVVATCVLERYVRRLPFHTFITRNTAVNVGVDDLSTQKRESVKR